MYCKSKGGLQNFCHSLEQRKWHPLLAALTGKLAPLKQSSTANSLVKMLRGEWGKERFGNKLQYELDYFFFRSVLVTSWLLLQYQYSHCSCRAAGYNQIFNKALPAGSNSVCEKVPQALPLWYGREYSHHPPWLHCSPGQSWKIPGSGRREAGKTGKHLLFMHVRGINFGSQNASVLKSDTAQQNSFQNPVL